MWDGRTRHDYRAAAGGMQYSTSRGEGLRIEFSRLLRVKYLKSPATPARPIPPLIIPAAHQTMPPCAATLRHVQSSRDGLTVDRWRFLLAMLICLISIPASADDIPTGEQIYRQKCAACHGAAGEGVADMYDDPLYGDRPLAEVIKIIDETMPDEKASECTGEEARRVGEYIYQAFYTTAARAKHAPPRIELARLTVPQYQNVVADLVGSFISSRAISDRRGLKGDYYNDRNFNRREKKLDRVDPRVDLQFGTKSPHEKIKDSEFSIRWEGSLLADASGEYEIGVKTENGFQLWVNDLDAPLVDGYVAAGPDPTLRGGAIRLLAGRAYPLKLDYFKYKDKTASVQLMWKPPHKTWEVIPERALATDRAAPTLVITTPLPADDGSYGYPRGTDVSQAWDEATTYAAIEAASRIGRQLPALANVKQDTPERQQRLKEFCTKFTERAFRRPLTDEQRQVYIDAQFAAVEDDDAAVKRSLLATLKSPYFLYVNLPRGEQTVDDYDVASRLALAMWDSLPDEELRQAAERGELQSREQIEAQARRMAGDPRATAKLRGFLRSGCSLIARSIWPRTLRRFPVSTRRQLPTCERLSSYSSAK